MNMQLHHKLAHGWPLALLACCLFAGCGKEESVDPHPAIPRALDPAYQKAINERIKKKYTVMVAHQKAYEKFEAAKKVDPEGKSEAYKAAEAEFKKTKAAYEDYQRESRAFVGNRIQQDLKKSKKARK